MTNKRDRLGFLDITDSTFVKKYDHGFTKPICLKWNESQIVFKKEKIEDCYKELFYNGIYEELELPTVHYDLGRFGDFRGVFSIDFNPENLPKITLDGILKNNVYCHRNLKILVDAEKKNNPTVNTKKVKDFITIAFIMQFLTSNGDLNTCNLEFLESDLIPFLYYDFNRCGLVKLRRISSYRYKMKSGLDSIYIEDKSSKKVLETFLKYGGKADLEMFKEYLERTKNINPKHIFERKEEQIEARIPYFNKKMLEYQFSTNLKQVDRLTRRKML